MVVFDDLDEIAGHITDAQKEASGEALVHTKTAQCMFERKRIMLCPLFAFVFSDIEVHD